MQGSLTNLKAAVLKAISHPTRLQLLEILSGGEKCVCELVAEIGGGNPTISKHLSILRNAGIVSDRREGVKIYYKLEVPCILNFMDCITAVIRSKAERELATLKQLGAGK